MGDCSVDAVVTDPPYELGFMGKSWDSSGVAYRVDLWGEVLRVLKPGGHLLAFGGSRTYHRLACAVEDAGFEIRDQIMWVYGSGFPKSLDVSKALDKAAGAEREVIGSRSDVATRIYDNGEGSRLPSVIPVTAPATDAAKRWQGWGTALKPAHEPVVVARKPLVGTVAQNVLLWGTGAINIDACRIAGEPWKPVAPNSGGRRGGVMGSPTEHPGGNPHTLGRWPANLVHDGSDEVLEHFPKQTSGANPTRRGGLGYHGAAGQDEVTANRGTETGSAARFFYCAKPGKAERNAGLDALPERIINTDTPPGSKGSNSPRAGAGRTGATRNVHPTVKPVALMRYLVRLVTPPDGVVLDPFLGSGTTAVAAILEGKRWVGCELTEEYVPIIEGRVAWAEANRGML